MPRHTPKPRRLFRRRPEPGARFWGDVDRVLSPAEKRDLAAKAGAMLAVVQARPVACNGCGARSVDVAALHADAALAADLGAPDAALPTLVIVPVCGECGRDRDRLVAGLRAARAREVADPAPTPDRES